VTLTHRELLECSRDRLVQEIDEANATELPALSRELRAVLTEIDAIPSAEAKAPADEIKKRREARRRAATG